MKRNIVHSVLIVISAICAFASPYSVDRIPNVHLADQTKYVSNPDGIVSPEAVAAVDSTLNRLRRETTAEAVAVVVSDIDGEYIDLFANELFNSWGLGKSDNNNGLLILVAVDRRKAVIRTGTGIEGLLPDGYCGRILRKKMFPAFARGDYDGGLIAAVNEVAARLGDETAAAEIRSEMDDADDASSSVSPLKVYLGCSAALALILAVIVIIKVASLRKKPPYDKYTAFEESTASHIFVRRTRHTSYRHHPAVAHDETLAQQPEAVSQLSSQDAEDRRGSRQRLSDAGSGLRGADWICRL